MNLPFSRSRNPFQTRPLTRGRTLGVIAFACLSLVIFSGAVPASAAKSTQADVSLGALSTNASATDVHLTSSTSTTSFPDGTPDASEPSGMAPPSANALPGYALTYETNFTGSKLPAGWDVYSGTPGNDPGGQWASSHVVVSGGVLQLNAFQDSAYNNEWVTGGLCQCGVSQVYGAYFVRSRMTGAGPTQAELLWPTGTWPPEIDFNETFGGDSSTMATVHYSGANLEDQRLLTIDMTQWHTWGVIWSPTSITYTVDGQAWAKVAVAAEIPNQPMSLDIQQQTFCDSGWACPTAPASTQINWVAEYNTAIQYKVTVSPFKTDSSTLSSGLKTQIRSLAETIKAKGYTEVTLVGYSDDLVTPAKDLAASKKQALAVAAYLKQQLGALQVSGIIVSAVGNGRAPSAATSPAPPGRATGERVVALIY